MDKIVEFKRGNVARRKSDGRKIVFRRDHTDTAGEYEYVCERPHQDDDFSYCCGSEYCRCMN